MTLHPLTFKNYSMRAGESLAALTKNQNSVLEPIQQRPLLASSGTCLPMMRTEKQVCTHVKLKNFIKFRLINEISTILMLHDSHCVSNSKKAKAVSYGMAGFPTMSHQTL